MMPMFLLDQKIDATEVSFWTGIVCQGISIAGSVIGGWLVTAFKYVTRCSSFRAGFSLFVNNDHHFTFIFNDSCYWSMLITCSKLTNHLRRYVHHEY